MGGLTILSAGRSKGRERRINGGAAISLLRSEHVAKRRYRSDRITCVWRRSRLFAAWEASGRRFAAPPL